MEPKDKNKLAAEFVERITDNQGAIHKVCNVYANQARDHSAIVEMRSESIGG